MNNKTALLVVGHGSKSVEANTQMMNVVDLVASQSDYGMARGAFMELAEPAIQPTLAEIYALGYRKVNVLPYFLYNGMHIKKDIPEILTTEKANYPGLEIHLAEPIGFEPLLADILLKRASGTTQVI